MLRLQFLDRKTFWRPGTTKSTRYIFDICNLLHIFSMCLIWHGKVASLMPRTFKFNENKVGNLGHLLPDTPKKLDCHISLSIPFPHRHDDTFDRDPGFDARKNSSLTFLAAFDFHFYISVLEKLFGVPKLGIKSQHNL